MWSAKSRSNFSFVGVSNLTKMPDRHVKCVPAAAARDWDKALWSGLLKLWSKIATHIGRRVLHDRRTTFFPLQGGFNSRSS